MSLQVRGVQLGELVSALGGELHGDPSIVVYRVAPLQSACGGDLTFVANPKYFRQLQNTQASAVIVPKALVSQVGLPCIAVDDSYLYFARVSQFLFPEPPVSPGVHPSAVTESLLPSSVRVDAGAVIGPGVEIGEGAWIGPGCWVGEGSHIGAGSRLVANVVVYPRTRIGARALIHGGVVLGADGFGFARERDGRWVKIPQTGRVVIGDDVEIGANTTIDRGALDDTVIGNGVKLDNQIQIAHNVQIGELTAMAGCVGVAGSTKIGRGCTIGGAAMIIGHLELADGVHVSSGTLVGKSIKEKGAYTGSVPFQDHKEWLRNFSHIRHLDKLNDRVKELEAKIKELEKKN